MRVNEVTRGPLFPAADPFATRFPRRVRGVAVEVGGLVLGTLLFPLIAVAAVLVDVALLIAKRKPPTALRLAAMGWWFLLGECVALSRALGIWLVTGGPAGRGSLRRRRLAYETRIWWARHHLGGASRLFGLRFVVEGLEHAGPGPAVLMLRHASILDNLLPDALVGHHHGIGVRCVIKKELEVLPLIDVGGRWVPTVFVRRGSGEGEAEAAKTGSIARDLGPGEVAMIYPEGTRFTDRKLARAQEIVRERRPDLAERALALRHVLPPRLGGPIGVLEEARGADVVLCAHVGFDGFEKVGDVWAGGLVGQEIRVRFWRIPAAEIPAGEAALTDWLYERWAEMDAWVGAHRGNAPVT